MDQIRRIILIAGLILPAVPAISATDAPECMSGDWSAQGARDGLRGLPDAFVARARACAGGGARLVPTRSPLEGTAYADYREARRATLALYCAEENAFLVGRRNEVHHGLCGADFEAPYRRGLAAHAAAGGHDGFVLGGVLTPLTPGGRPINPAPPPRMTRWSDADGDWAAPPVETAAATGETRDWRNLWSRTPVHQYEQPKPPAPRPAPPPRRTYDDDDDGWDRDDLWIVFPKERKGKDLRKHRRDDRFAARPDRDRQVARGVRRDRDGEPKMLKFWEKHGVPGSVRRRR